MRKLFLKKLTLSLMTACTIISLTACGTSGKELQTASATDVTTEAAIAIDPAAISQELIDAGVFTEGIETNTYIEMLLGISESEYTSAIFYVGNGATAEKLAIFETTDADAATILKDKCQQQADKQLEDYISYMPNEADKLNNTIIEASDKYVIFCVANDYKAADEIIGKYFK